MQERQSEASHRAGIATLLHIWVALLVSSSLCQSQLNPCLGRDCHYLSGGLRTYAFISSPFPLPADLHCSESCWAAGEWAGEVSAGSW